MLKFLIKKATIITIFPLSPPPSEKNQRLKEAKEEAGVEIDRYRKDREEQFNDKKKNYDGSKDDFQQKMDKEKEERLRQIGSDVSRNKKEVIHRLLEMVYDIQPELHRNLQVEKS